MSQSERTEHLIKTTRQRARGALDVQTQAGIAHQMSNGKRRLVKG